MFSEGQHIVDLPPLVWMVDGKLIHARRGLTDNREFAFRAVEKTFLAIKGK